MGGEGENYKEAQQSSSPFKTQKSTRRKSKNFEQLMSAGNAAILSGGSNLSPFKKGGDDYEENKS